jgi:Protein of unknown function (DUF2851)
MREELLQFIWRFQYFNPHELLTEAGDPLLILSPGEPNTHQGPDFLNAQVRIGDTLMAGSIELHIRASDWRRHAHDGDPHYTNVILHVVWKNDWSTPGIGIAPGETAGPLPPERIPLLVLRDRVPKLLLGQYEKWMKNPAFIPCERMVAKTDASVRAAWQQRLLIQRLHRRTLLIRDWLQQNEQDWEETTWWMMARNFGLPVNGMAFEAIGKSLPVRLLARYRQEPLRLEALLLGQAGLLEKGFPPGYPQSLQKEYRYLQQKHRLSPIQIPLSFLRMRPAHFPTLRLAQLATVLSGHTAWFAAIRGAGSPRDLEAWLSVEAAGAHIGARSKKLGSQMIRNILVNTFVPLLYAYGALRNEPAFRDKAVLWLQRTTAEKNSVLSGFGEIGVTCKNAADSQALLELKVHYCDARKCLDCAIGQVLLGLTGDQEIIQGSMRTDDQAVRRESP